MTRTMRYASLAVLGARREVDGGGAPVAFSRVRGGNGALVLD